ncbi:MAG: hypothetical protein J6S83_14780 [Lachnospiraceae bacterium]|nr:hypothetical protein [Lachnospiraceae bacterium]
MYEQSARWNEYYRELEPEARRRLFDELTMTQPDDGANEYRMALFQARYVDGKTPGKYVDRFLFQCVNFGQVFKSARLFRKSARKEVERTLDGMLFDGAAALGEAGERALYWELRNAAARYFRTCQSPDYGRSLFGLLKSGDVNRQERMCRDAREMSVDLSERLGMEKELRIWNEAVRDSYFACEPGAERLWNKKKSE